MPSQNSDASAALALAGDVGSYFETLPWRPQAGWRPLSELTEPIGAMADRVAEASATLARISGVDFGELEVRVVASTISLGLFARLVAPPLAATVLAGVVPRWSIESLWWHPVAGGPLPLAVDDTRGTAAGDVEAEDGAEEVVALLGSSVIAGPVTAVVRRVHAEFSVSEQVLWGNVASALTGAMTMLIQARPDRADATSGLVEGLLAQGPLIGTGVVSRPDPSHPRRSFLRRSCCLFYRVPGGGYCGDCVLTPPAVPLEH